ncbi:hypothetical protein Tco_0260195 [Tanacetum coccineum]
MTQKLGLVFGFTKKACFVCGSYSHLIKDCDFHEKRMAKKSVLKNIGKDTGQREIKPVWNSVQRINHQNKFVPSAVLTRSGRVPVSAAKQSSLRATSSTSTFRPVNIATHTNRVNVSKLKTNAFHKSNYARVMIELRADVELKDTIVVSMPKIIREGYTQEECPKNIRLGVAKNLKKPCQTSRGIPVGLKVGFKPHKEYRHVPKNPTANSSGNKKKGVVPTTKVSNSNPFEALNSVDNDVELECLGDYDSEDEVASVDNDLARSMASERVGFGTQSLLEQWRDSYGNGDYDEDPYDDDMYKGQDLPQELQAICDNLDI